jgi:hypothetical protein
MKVFFCLFSLLLARGLCAQAPVTWKYKAVPTTDGYLIQLFAELQSGWHLYSQTQPEDAIALPTLITF